MTLILLNLQSNQLIKLDNENPLIIGRGNVEGCFDKRVSRNHGRISCTLDGKVRVEALHCNPCFITRNGVPPILQINKNEEETLSEGDFLGLLPNAFWFKVTTDKDIKIKTGPENIKTEIVSDENNQTNKVEENHSTAVPKNENVVQEDAIPDVVKSQENSSYSSSSVLNPSCTSSGFGTPQFEKTRRLPLWMYEIDEPVEANQSTNKRSVGSDLLTSKKKQKTSTEIDKKDGDNTDGGGDVISHPFNIPSSSRVVNIKESKSPSFSKGSVAQNESGEESIKKEGYESEVNNECGSRPICQYEGKCYRKNPQHKIQFSHPGDSDYVSYEDRPFCPYGAACYRKNEKHRVEFRHPKPSTSSSRGSVGEERPPCLKGSSCRNQNPKHRKDLYHPPKGYICHFSSTDSNSSCDSPPSYYSDFDDYYCNAFYSSDAFEAGCYGLSDSDDDFLFLRKKYQNLEVEIVRMKLQGGSQMFFVASSPLPAKRRRKKVKKENSDVEDGDEYDLEDPFINDASSDEYVPTDLDSEEEEDLDASRDED